MFHPLSINPVLNGFLLVVGCQTLAYTDPDKLCVDLNDYLKDPEGTQKRILETEAINKCHLLEAPRSTGEPVPMTATGFAAEPQNAETPMETLRRRERERARDLQRPA